MTQSITSIPDIHPQSTSSRSLLETLNVEPQHGLSEPRVLESRELYGSNELAEAAPEPLWRKLLAQFKDLVIWIIIVAAAGPFRGDRGGAVYHEPFHAVDGLVVESARRRRGRA
jgi:magnesium-transporting ATPase (P-type)